MVNSKIFFVRCSNHNSNRIANSVNGTSTWGGIANTSSWDQYLGHPAPHIDLANATSSSIAAQPSSTAVHSAGVSISAGTVSTLLLLLGTFVVMLA